MLFTVKLGKFDKNVLKDLINKHEEQSSIIRKSIDRQKKEYEHVCSLELENLEKELVLYEKYKFLLNCVYKGIVESFQLNKEELTEIFEDKE